jgi:dienelactone hydrolase
MGTNCEIQLAFLKEHFIDAFAERFQAAGYAALLYDHRNWGAASDGTPRNESNFFQQAEDYSDATTFVLSLTPEIDPARICVWGAGHSGGVVMQMAALDPRVKSIITMVPFISGQADSKNYSTGYLDWARKERQDIVWGVKSPDNPEYIPIFAQSLEEAIWYPFSNFQEYFRKSQVLLLVAWCKSDIIFPQGVETFKRYLPQAEVHLLDVGHVATETNTVEIGDFVMEFLGKLIW